MTDQPERRPTLEGLDLGPGEYWTRKRQLPFMDGAAIQQVLEEYGPVARRLLGKE
ncbi:hypothetical protein ACQP2P_27375 [Dactylosporangium sp. CA-139114]|uniref:hypothetical protein n=1 Tax=Dactylosporangium sp. CA-139114 TaxID=3239931 RepID=UPI003D97738A